MMIKKNEYMENIKTLLNHVRPKLFIHHHLEFKNVFGAISGYVNGRIFISCGKFGIALKLPLQALEIIFKEKGVKPLKFFPNGHIKREYAVLPKNITEDSSRFGELVDE